MKAKRLVAPVLAIFAVTALAMVSCGGRVAALRSEIKSALKAGDLSKAETIFDWSDGTFIRELIKKGLLKPDGRIAALALEKAASGANDGLVSFLLAGSVPADGLKLETTPLIEASSCAMTGSAEERYFRIVKSLQAAGADIGAIRRRDGATSLIAAARANNPQIVSFLLEKGADANSVDSDGETPLVACLRGRSDGLKAADQKTVELLMGAGTDLRKKTSYGMRAVDVVAANPAIPESLRESLKNEYERQKIQSGDAAAAVSLNSAGMARYRAGDMAGAERNFRLALGKDPDFKLPHYNLACVLALGLPKDYAAAAEGPVYDALSEIQSALENAVRLDPGMARKAAADGDLSSLRGYADFWRWLGIGFASPEIVMSILTSPRYWTEPTEGGEPQDILEFSDGGRFVYLDVYDNEEVGENMVETLRGAFGIDPQSLDIALDWDLEGLPEGRASLIEHGTLILSRPESAGRGEPAWDKSFYPAYVKTANYEFAWSKYFGP
jgi:hypothetical protein